MAEVGKPLLDIDVEDDLSDSQGSPAQLTANDITAGEDTSTEAASIAEAPSDQELLSDLFDGRWVALPYVYNALKTLRWEGVHGAVWRDEEVKAVHYIFAKKPWHEEETDAKEKKLDDPSLRWWEANWRRQRLERDHGVKDGFSG